MYIQPSFALLLISTLIGYCYSETEEAPYKVGNNCKNVNAPTTIIFSCALRFAILQEKLILVYLYIQILRQISPPLPGSGRTRHLGGESLPSYKVGRNIRFNAVINENKLPWMVWNTKLPALRWVSTDAHDIVVHEGTEWRAAFFRLFNYIDGTNSEDTKIPMTKPVSARYIGTVT